MGFEVLDSIQLALDSVQWWAFVEMVVKFRDPKKWEISWPTELLTASNDGIF
jgi:hypothetical protein